MTNPFHPGLAEFESTRAYDIATRSKARVKIKTNSNDLGSEFELSEDEKTIIFKPYSVGAYRFDLRATVREDDGEDTGRVGLLITTAEEATTFWTPPNSEDAKGEVLTFSWAHRCWDGTTVQVVRKKSPNAQASARVMVNKGKIKLQISRVS